MVDLGKLLNSKEFKEYYNNSTPEEKEKMDMAIQFAKKKLQTYLDAIDNEIRNRRTVD